MPTEPTRPEEPDVAQAPPTDGVPPTPEPAATPAPTRGPRRILKVIRLFIRAAVVLVLLAALGGALLYFTPHSWRWTDRLIREQVGKATGLRLEFSRAVFTLSRGQLRIESPSLLDPKTRATLVALESVECVMDTAALARSILSRDARTTLRIGRIAVLGPLDLQLNERDGTLELSEGLARLVELAQDQRNTTGTQTASQSPAEAAQSSIDLSIGSLDLDGIRVELVHLSEEGDQPLARISDADLRVEFEDDSLRPRHLLCHGRFEGVEGEAGFKLDLQPNSDRDEMAVDLTVQPFDTNKNLLTAPQFHLRTSTITMRGMLRSREGGDWALHTDMRIPRITLADLGDARKDYDFDAAQMYAEIQWVSKERHVKIADVKLTSRDGDLATQGRIELFSPYRYAFNVDSLRLRDRTLEMVEQLMVKEELLARPIGGSVELHGTVNGRFEQLNPDEVNLDYTLGEIALTFPDFPEPVTEVQLQGSFRNHEFLLTRGQARVQNIPVEFTGGIRGRLIEGRVDHAEIAWKTAGELKDVSDIIRRSTKGPVSDFSYKGDIQGAGAIRFDNPEMGDWKTMMQKADIEGWLKFNKAELRHADLREPIRDLSGQFSYTRSAARLQNIAGNIDGVPFTLDGAVVGSDHFWNDPRTSATLETSLNLEERDKYFGWLEAEPPTDWPALKGRAAISASMSGPLDQWRDWTYEGTASIENLSVPLDTRLTSGSLEAPRVDLAFTPRELRLVRGEGQWQGVNLTASGRLGLDEGRFNLTADGPMSGVKAALAKPLERFLVDGRVSATHELVLTRKDVKSHPMKSFADFFPPADDKKPAVQLDDSPTTFSLADQWLADGGGQILLTDVEFTFELMPTRLMNANGKLLYNHQKLWNDGKIPLKVGEKSSGTMADIEVVYQTETEPTRLTGKVTGGHLDVDQWVSGWKKSQRKPTPPPAEERVKLQIDVAVETNSVSYHGLQGEDLRGVFHLTDFAGKRHILSVENASARHGEGLAGVNIRWEHFATNDIEEYDIHVEKFDVASLMRSFTSLKSQGGIASGLITGDIRMKQVGKGKNPFNGGGSFTVQDSRFVSNAVLGGLGRILRIEELFNDVSFPKIEGAFDIRDNVIVVEGDKQVLFENPVMLHPLDLKLQGSLGPENALDLTVGVRFLPRVGDIPVIGKVWDVVNGLTGSIFSYNVRGTIEQPEISVLPRLSQ